MLLTPWSAAALGTPIVERILRRKVTAKLAKRAGLRGAIVVWIDESVASSAERVGAKGAAQWGSVYSSG